MDATIASYMLFARLINEYLKTLSDKTKANSLAKAVEDASIANDVSLVSLSSDVSGAAQTGASTALKIFANPDVLNNIAKGDTVTLGLSATDVLPAAGYYIYGPVKVNSIAICGPPGTELVLHDGTSGSTIFTIPTPPTYDSGNPTSLVISAGALNTYWHSVVIPQNLPLAFSGGKFKLQVQEPGGSYTGALVGVLISYLHAEATGGVGL